MRWHGVGGLDLANQHWLGVCVIDLCLDVFAMWMARAAIRTVRVAIVGLGMLSVRVFFLAKGAIGLALSAVVVVFLWGTAVTGEVSRFATVVTGSGITRSIVRSTVLTRSTGRSTVLTPTWPFRPGGTGILGISRGPEFVRGLSIHCQDLCHSQGLREFVAGLVLLPEITEMASKFQLSIHLSMHLFFQGVG